MLCTALLGYPPRHGSDLHSFVQLLVLCTPCEAFLAILCASQLVILLYPIPSLPNPPLPLLPTTFVGEIAKGLPEEFSARKKDKLRYR